MQAVGGNWQVAKAHAHRVIDCVGQRGWWRNDWDFADAAHAERAARIWHLHNDRLDHGNIERRGHAVVQQRGVS